MQSVSIMIVGVGGQGTLLSSKLLGRVFADCGLDVKVSEVHGMSQRGGSVVTYVRAGERVYSPIICHGEADYIIAFEKLEAARYLPYLKVGGALIFNPQEIAPMACLYGKVPYPSQAIEENSREDIALHAIDALTMAISCGSAKAVNIVLLGYLAKQLYFIEKDAWERALAEVVSPKYLALNQKAFELGYTYTSEVLD
ncbi:MAG: indolepyruvate oxidoreductase subunit beta [Clostridia bacterium]|nr:indolepyruvate oxidoreductase subunit beta [Clostridia bacterium]